MVMSALADMSVYYESVVNGCADSGVAFGVSRGSASCQIEKEIDEGWNMIKISSACYAGHYHINQGKFCEDRFAWGKAESHNVIVLCDGATMARRGRMAAGMVAEILAEELKENFERYLYEDPDTVIRELTKRIDETLLLQAKKDGLADYEYACTILAAAMNEQGQFLCIHLGDGLILRKRKGKKTFQLVSKPENILLPNRTYLTRNCSLFQHLRLYRWYQEDTEKILLLTDGAKNILFSPVGLGGKYACRLPWGNSGEELQAYLSRYEGIAMDDYSFAMLERR